MGPVKIAIVGIDRLTDQLLAGLAKTDRLSLCALCDTHPAVLNRCRNKYPDLQFYDDPREMVIRAKPNLVLIWRNCCESEFISRAIDEGCWLILRPPIAGGLASAVRTIKHAEKNNVGVFVWSPWLFLPCYEGINDWLSGQQIHCLYYRSFSSLPDMELPAEETLLAAGTYPSVFLAQQWMGLPERIYCHQFLRSGQSSTSQNTIQYYGLLNMIYQKAMGTVHVGINAGPLEEKIVVTCPVGQVRAEPIEAHLYDCDGKLIASSHRYELLEARLISYMRQFEHVWQLYIEQRRSAQTELKRHLGVLAILESAVISARTGHPEQLAKIVDLAHLTDFS